VLRSTTARHHIAPTTKKSAAFSLVAPGGTTVAIAGTFSNWELQPMTKGVDGVWRITLQLAPGLHEYRFLVDSEWREDPNNRRKAINDLGGFNSVCEAM
jgi:1,4-alpha-glucan branching enzyme